MNGACLSVLSEARVVSCVSEVILIDKRPSETKESKDTVIKRRIEETNSESIDGLKT